MNENLSARILWLSAAVFLVIGVGMTVQNLNTTDDLYRRFKKKSGELKILRNMETDLARFETAKKKTEQIPEKHPVSLNGLLQEMFPGSKADDMKDSRKDLIDGWLIRQKEISMNDIPVGKSMEFVQKAESQKLPWCLTRCVIRAVPRTTGIGQVILTMEALDKTE
ncbi:MAG: hypothetical protein PHR77_17320 [Kiritimatiellae bacterium]|nr:hypothetical protein [Kiritimatiellia bacterium]MDD5521665.1 hypothetical protein [Kiritimatiellia bacterium]